MSDSLRFRNWVLYGLLWIFLAACFASQAYLEYEFKGNTASWVAMFAWEGPGWTLWGILSIVIYGLTQRYPIDRRNWLRYLPLYLVAGVALVLIHLGLHVVISDILLRPMYKVRAPITEQFQVNFFTRITWRIFVFTILVIACHGWAAQRRFRNEERRAGELQLQVIQAQLEALKMQMHPHFLFNTLHSLSELIHRDVNAAEEVIVRLGDFLRLTLTDTGRQQVPLERELEFLQCYLEIEKIRLQERLQVAIHIDPDTLQLPVPNLILQPIVENAVRHGIAPWTAPGKLEIRAFRRDSVLRIEVQDSGPGMPDGGAKQNGLGLANTRSRLEKVYGSKQTLKLQNGPSGGLLVTLEIPVEAS